MSLVFKARISEDLWLMINEGEKTHTSPVFFGGTGGNLMEKVGPQYTVVCLFQFIFNTALDLMTDVFVSCIFLKVMPFFPRFPQTLSRDNETG